MDLFPAIDIRDGRCVRLLRGDYEAETAFGDPVEVAQSFVEAGAERLHVVDLDAARSGVRSNAATVEAMVAAVDVPIELGGGVRSVDDVAQLIALGVERVVMGTAALENPELLRIAAEQFPFQVVLGLDYQREASGELFVAVHGWTVKSSTSVGQLLEEFDAVPLAAVLATGISQDGTLEGPDLLGLASGGVGSLQDLEDLAALGASDAHKAMAGVIVGRALLEGLFTIEEAKQRCR